MRYMCQIKFCIVKNGEYKVVLKIEGNLSKIQKE